MKIIEKIIKGEIINEVNNKICKIKRKKFYYLNIPEQNINIILKFNNENEFNEFKKLIGKNDYQIRKGLGINNTVHRVVFVEQYNDTLSYFYKYEKKGKKLILNKNTKFLLEHKYIYPYILSRNLKEKKIEWKNLYCIFPYEYGEKQPIPEETLKIKAPNIYKYFQKNKKILENQSDYNKRIQNINEKYGVIRVGEYTYSDIFVIMRDNNKLNPNIIKKIKTHWNEIKQPLFDGHISYISKKPDGNNITTKEAKYILNKLKNAEKYILQIYNKRNIPTKLFIKIPLYEE